jgi:wyosine [tRNA(Phe)-imidazoG37] synthetase (radical SAM superfamily)
MAYRYLFGPVPSRRLGISLGVDLVPPKICSMDCVYCECGATTRLTVERDEYVPTAEVIRELDAFLAGHPHPDFVTFSGAGEPTLHAGIGAILRHLKSRHTVPVALITNATLLDRPPVRAELLALDVLLPSLDAASDEVMQRINRPHPSVHVEGIVAGLEAFRREFPGEIWLEVFVLSPLNTTVAELENLQRAIDRIRPDRVQLNSLDRPGTETWVGKVPPDELEALAGRIAHPRVEVVSRYRRRQDIRAYRSDIESAIVETIARRPCTVEDLCSVLGLKDREVLKYLDVLESDRRLRAEVQERGIFYRLAPIE